MTTPFKISILLYFLFRIQLTILGQGHPNSFSLSTFLELHNQDSIKVYFDNDGRIVERSCATYYRIGKIDPKNCNVLGSFTDYYVGSGKMFKCEMRDNVLTGSGTYYYQNGNIKETGIYINDKRSGLWNYYYPNGKLEKVLCFKEDAIQILFFCTSNGDTLVKDGNGFYWGSFYQIQNSTPFLIGGKVKNYEMDGEWSLNLPSTLDSLMIQKNKFSADIILPPRKLISREYYSEGTFNYSKDNVTPGRGNRVIIIQGFVVNESLNLYNNSFGCKGIAISVPPMYKKDMYFTGTYFFPALTKDIEKNLSSNYPDQWIIVSLNIDNSNRLGSLLVFSSIKDISMEQRIAEIIKTKYSSWKSMKLNNKKVPANLFFSIIIADNRVLIPVSELNQNFY